MSRIWTITKKELWTYFSSPIAFIFLFAYLLASLFTFFWVEKFFSRNIADLRPLFEWMPVLLIFLISTLTMKMWSEERRMGTVEFLLTLPVKVHELVIGKFLSCLLLVAIALGLTVGLPVTVGLIGQVDWGPVFGAYFASLLLAAAYISVGLFISSRSDNQIVSLISTVVVCGILYLIGSEAIVGFFGNKGGELLRLIGTGSRFDAVSKGVMDLRDIYYYLSIVAIFMTLNVYSLEKMKWSTEASQSNHGTIKGVMGLLVANFLMANFWLYNVHFTRIDMTKNQDFSISDSTLQMIDKLQEPLLIRGYFSAKTHPLLAPLVPGIRDYLEEYQLASNGKVRTEIIDPRENEELEAEANQKYSIEPVPFQVADRHSASMLSSYFNIVVQYGDQFEVLGFDKLIEIKQDGHSGIDVQLRNLEYDITRSIQKVLHSFNNTDNLFASLKNPVKFVGYISESTLPDELKQLTKDMKKSLQAYEEKSGGKFSFEFLNPAKDSELAKEIKEKYGFRSQRTLFSPEEFYFYPTILSGESSHSLGIPEELSVSNFEKSLDATLQRLVPGFLKTVGIYTPPGPPMNPMMMQYGGGPQGKQFQSIQQLLGQNYTTQSVDFADGTISNDVDVLLVIAPKDLGEKELFAIDQFLMKGGSVVLATSPASVDIGRNGFELKEQSSGLESWLSGYGIEIPKEFVLDKSNMGFPEIRKRYVQGVAINQPVLAPYPMLVDVRDDGLNDKNAITSGLGQITMAWSSPLNIDQEKNKDRTVTNLVSSSKNSWKSSELKVESDRDQYPELGFKEPTKDQQGSSVMAAMVEGRFTSYFVGKDSPLLNEPEKKEAETQAPGQKDKEEDKKPVVAGVIEKSPESARLIVFASNEFISDDVIKISSMINQTQYIQPLQLVENALDWSTQDRLLLSIRSRGHFARTLVPLSDSDKGQIEFINYLIAALGLLATVGIYSMIRKSSREKFKALDLV